MQFRPSTLLYFFAVILASASNVWANDLRPWGEGKDYVQLETVSAVNQLPVNFSTEQLSALLGHFYKREGSEEPSPYFSQDEISRIASRLVPLFAKAKSAEDIDFGTSFNPSGFFMVPRKLNAGRLFVENGRLNLIVGMCAAEQDITYQQLYGKYRDLDHGSRTKSADKLGCELLAGNNAERVDNRADWLRLNINAALAANPVPVFSPASKTLTFGTTTASDPVTATSPAQSPSTNAKPSDAEERLITLKQLHDKGLITDAEYEQKRAAVLNGI
jgi:hypothetical protein